MSTSHPTTADLALESREHLTHFVLDRVATLVDELGFGWTPRPDAPDTYPALRRAFAISRETGEPLPVSNENSASVIFTNPEGNFAFRFLHDCSHVLHGLSFSLPDEFELAVLHLEDLQSAGFDPDTPEYKLLRADTLGQLIVNAVAKRFPFEQERFGITCLRDGFDRGILDELQRSR